MSYIQLTECERYQIYVLNKAGHKPVDIAKHINRHPSTIYREMKRNKGLKGYRPKQAQRLAEDRRRNADKACKLTPQIIGWIETLLRQELSPQQVCHYLWRHKHIALHHETIYQYIYTDKALGGDLYTHMRIAAKPYRKRYGIYDRRGRIPNRVSIDKRPAIVETRRRIGDWEGDTIIGKAHSGALVTLVERKTQYSVILKTEGKRADKLAEAVILGLHPLKNKVHTITVDNGLEFAKHEQITDALGATIYFAHPNASWERGLNENTNGLIRQYFPKEMDLNQVTDKDIAFVMDRLNNRPRESLGFKSPNELFHNQWKDLLAA